MDISLKEFLLYAAGIMALIQFGWNFFRSGSKKNTAQDTKILELQGKLNVMDAEVKMRREFINQQISEIHSNLSSIKTNHIDHIEKDIQTISVELAEIRVMLNERLPKKL